MNIQISNLDSKLQNEDIRDLFATHGEVTSAEIAIDGFTEKSRGFAYVEMPNEEEARAAIAAINNTEVNGMQVTVKEVEPRNVQKGSYKVGNGPVNIYRFKK
jgi:RNA recognition motif-containing protein